VEEAITDGETGILTDFFDVEAMADRVAEALKSPGDFREIRRRARESVVARYALEDCVGKQLALIRGQG
jgi:glycosyltransferase involved in cell wall biosynthesis